MQKTSLLLVFVFITSSSLLQAQTFSFSGQVGYSGPQGDAFSDPNSGDRLSSFGLGADFDLLYRFDKLSEKLFAGITYNSNALFGKESDGFFDVGIYGLQLFGVKGLYRFSDKGFSPYGGLSLGLSRFSTPDVTVNGQTIKGKGSFSFGIRPEVGIDINGFLISGAYFFPMDYNINSDTGDFDGSAGAFQISIGYRLTEDISGWF